MRRHEDATLAILAGGRGTRLGGVAKGLLKVEGRTVLERLLDLKSQVRDVLLVSNDANAYEGLHLPSTGDVVPGRGAPGGLHSALAHARTPWVYLVACDMPFVTPAVLDTLMTFRRSGAQFVCFERAGRFEPMPALYARSLEPLVHERLAAEPSFRELLKGVEGDLVPVETALDSRAAGRVFVSLNTPEDLDRFCAKFP